jgi:hypothetical protein
VGVGDEEGVHSFKDALGEVVELAAVEEAAPAERPDVEEEDRVVEEPGAEDRLDMAKGESSAHAGNDTTAWQG